jgi:hypothetical protein
MLSLLACSPVAYQARGAVLRTQSPAAASPSMLFGLGEKKETALTTATPTGMVGMVVPTKAVGAAKPTKTVVKAVPAGGFELIDAPTDNKAILSFEPFSDGAVISELDVLKAQANWANSIKTISKIYLAGGDYVGAAGSAAGELYGYGHSNVLFKPTKAAEYPFRPTAESAMSYFVGGSAVPGGYDEDAGFAINGGNGWANVVFQNHQVELCGNTAIAMGTYWFTSAADGSETKVEYTFGYKKNEDGKVRIFLHHSSVPYSTGASGPAPVTEEEVLQVQAKWAAAIKSISKIHKEGGDYIKAAGEAAGELYAYGHSNVLFKPTKAAEYQFRPTGEEAMSYFVGGNVVDNGYAEDAGFAINGGKGWSECIYDNHQVEIKNGVGIAMGNYYFTSAADDSKTKVEYTFGYTRCDDGKVRIFLHHSSVPYSA